MRQAFKGIGLAAAVLGIGAGVAVSSGGCGSSGSAAAGTVSSAGTATTTRPVLPVLDQEAPTEFSTASFAYG